MASPISNHSEKPRRRRWAKTIYSPDNAAAFIFIEVLPRVRLIDSSAQVGFIGIFVERREDLRFWLTAAIFNTTHPSGPITCDVSAGVPVQMASRRAPSNIEVGLDNQMLELSLAVMQLMHELDFTTRSPLIRTCPLGVFAKTFISITDFQILAAGLVALGSRIAP